ncbi:MAG: TerC/Alx family metal homeostasis membrane protein [Bacteroidales bacterium]
MISSEAIFFSLFIVFIAAMLAIDLGIFDRHSHEIKFKEALTWTIVWVSLALGFYVLLLFFGDKIHGLETVADIQEKVNQYRHNIVIPTDADFDTAIKIYRKNLGLEYITGYLVEYMLSVDNVFVMIMIFISFGTPKKYYKLVLMWGIIGAVVLRFIFIFLSSALIQRFEWILLIFGAFLVFTGIKMFMDRNKEQKIDTKNHPIVKFASKYFRIYPVYFSQHFWFRNKHDNNRIYFTPLFLVLLVIEFSDVIFAIDSVPAIFSITQDPYIVFFSNIFAILGLRSLFFVLSNVITMFRFLKHGLSFLLVFIGLKMLFHNWLSEIGFETIHSLYVILGIIGISIALSLLFPEKKTSEVKTK